MTDILKKIISIILVASVLLLSGCGTAGKNSAEKDIIAVSFYPVYIFTLNLTEGIDELSVECMAEQSVGCLHDYTITAKDAKLLNDAKAFVINGGGMEGFIEDMSEAVENLKVIDSSQGIEMLCAEGGHHAEANEEHHSHNHHHMENSHIWMSVDNAKIQVSNIAEGLSAEFPQYEDIIKANCTRYLGRLDKLSENVEKAKARVNGENVVVFHNGYEYLLSDLGLHIVAAIESDEGAEPSAKELVKLTEDIRENNVKALFTDPDYKGSAAEILANETKAEIYVVSPFVSGEVSATAYEDVMNKNIEAILKAVS